MTGLTLLAGLVLDGWLGEPRWLWRRLTHPAIVMGRAVETMDHRLNRGTNRRMRGLLAVILLAAMAMLAGWVLSWFGGLVEALVLAILLAQRSLADHVSDVAAGLRRSLTEGRRQVARIVSRDTAGMDAPRVARAAIESAAENLSDGVVAPAFWFLVGGLPGLVLYKTINTADSMIGYRNERYEEFGWAAARLDDLLNLIPARLTALIVALRSGHMSEWSDIVRDARAHRSPNAGWPEAAVARALGVALAGPRVYDGELRDLAWVNPDGRHDIGAPKVDAAVAILWQVWRVLLVIALVVACLGAL